MKICVARAHGGVGDILFMTPGIKALAEANHEVHVAIDRHRTKNDSYYLLLKDNPYITKILDYRYVNPKSFDKYIDLTSVAYQYEQAGFPYSRTNIFNKKLLNLTKEEKPILHLKNESKSKYIALHFKSVEIRRSLPDKTCKELITLLLENTNYELLLLDNTFCVENKRVKSCRDMNVLEAAELINESALFVGVDSGFIHIAGALEKPIVGLFGSIDPKLRIGKYKAAKALWSEVKCRGCFYKPCYEDYKCMKSFQAKEIYNFMVKNNENLF